MVGTESNVNFLATRPCKWENKVIQAGGFEDIVVHLFLPQKDVVIILNIIDFVLYMISSAYSDNKGRDHDGKSRKRKIQSRND